MKTRSTLFLILLGLSISTVACKKCQTCTYQSVEEEVCRNSFSTPQSYDAYILALENAGYECN
ncbi:MAG: hypothetical protein H6603_03845 [Flavobacteriales bacterium]|nr:hypothetical protein [Flavobacteriales bacterium]